MYCTGVLGLVPRYLVGEVRGSGVNVDFGELPLSNLDLVIEVSRCK
jgi:hypothetical protein